MWLALSGSASAGEKGIDFRKDVFLRGQDGYHTYRIPTMVVTSKGTVLLGTVKGDHHDIGKNIVGMLMRGVGFEVFDLGVDVSADRFIESISAQKAEIVAISALLSTTVPSMEDTVTAIKGSYVASKSVLEQRCNILHV